MKHKKSLFHILVTTTIVKERTVRLYIYFVLQNGIILAVFLQSLKFGFYEVREHGWPPYITFTTSNIRQKNTFFMS